MKHHMDIINFACMKWNFVRISASLSALCTNINQIWHWHCISCKILPHFDVRTISATQNCRSYVFMDPQIASQCNGRCFQQVFQQILRILLRNFVSTSSSHQLQPLETDLKYRPPHAGCCHGEDSSAW